MVPRHLFMTLKRKFLILYTGLVLIPFLALSVFLTAVSVRQSEANLEYGNQMAFQQTRQLISYFMHNVNYSINTLLNDDQLRGIIEKNNEKLTLEQQMQDMLYIRDLLANFRAKDEIDEIRLYVRNSAFYIGGTSSLQTVASVSDTDWYRYAESKYPARAIIPSRYLPEGGIIALAKSIKSATNYTATVGMIRFDIRLSTIERLLGGTGAGEETMTFLINQTGDIIVTSNAADVAFPADLSAQYANGEAHRVIIDHRLYVLFAGAINDTDWYLVNMTPYTVIIASILPEASIYLILLLLLTLSAVVFVYFFNRRFLSRITFLKEHMAAVQHTLPSVIVAGRGNDEIDELIRAYNFMLTRADSLMQEQYNLGNQIRELELQALYEQINPHFLYNTMSMINWMAEDGQVEHVSQVIAALASFYKLCLNKGNAYITLREEFQIIDAYLFIQEMRFSRPVELLYDTADRDTDLVIPKLTLQPLIENALVHGILKKQSYTGLIKISTASTGKKLIITVADNGAGIPPDILEQLNNGTLLTPGKHYGIFNIVKRLRLYYGSECGIRFTSEAGSWTEAIITITLDGGSRDDDTPTQKPVGACAPAGQ